MNKPPLLLRNRVLIFEGPDCTGKSTLIRRLAFMFNGIIWHTTGRPDFHSHMSALHEEVLKNVEFNVEFNQHPIFLDRAWPSEICYGQVLRPQWQVLFDVNFFKSHFANLNTGYVFCRSINGCFRQRENPDPGHPYSMEEYLAVEKNYAWLEEQLRNEGLPVYSYCIEEHGYGMTKWAEEVLCL